MITIVARCSVQPDRVEAFTAIALDLVGASRREAGNVSYDVYEDLADHATFTFIEEWKDQAAIDLHMASPHFKGFGERAAPLLAGPLEVALYRKLS